MVAFFKRPPTEETLDARIAVLSRRAQPLVNSPDTAPVPVPIESISPRPATMSVPVPSPSPAPDISEEDRLLLVRVGVLIGTAFPHMVVGRMGKRRVAAFIALFPEAIDLMVRAIRSGLPISEAIVGAGREIADPVGAELGRVEAGMRLGRDLDSLLWDIATRIDVPEFRFFIIALSVQRETGGNLGETLANLADVLRRRRQMRAKVRAMSSETRATTMILAGLPVVVIVLLALTSPHYLTPLVSDVRGLLLDGLGFAMLGTGVFIMMKMARFEI